jgi:hypothetical protein
VGGGKENVQEKAFLINCPGITRQDWYGSVTRPHQVKK